MGSGIKASNDRFYHGRIPTLTVPPHIFILPGYMLMGLVERKSLTHLLSLRSTGHYLRQFQEFTALIGFNALFSNAMIGPPLGNST